MTELSERVPGAAVLVIGIGNDLRGDDGAGRAVVEAIQEYGPPGVRAVWTHQIVPELAVQMSWADRAIFVDATVAACRRARARRLVAGPAAVGGHWAGPEALLGLATLAGLPVPEAFLVTVPAHDLGLTTDLSPASRAAVCTATALVLRLCVPGRPPRTRTAAAQ